MRSARLVDLLSAAALVAELDIEEPEEDAGVQELRPDSPATVGCQAREVGELQAAWAAAIFPAGHGTTPTKLDRPQNSRGEVPSLKKWLPFVREFTATGNDWAAFQRRFTTTCELAGWTDVEALRALLTTLDDDTLVDFYTITPKDKVMLPHTFAQMAGGGRVFIMVAGGMAAAGSVSCVQH
ncbi:unnamed protein product [Lampetra planeri]